MPNLPPLPSMTSTSSSSSSFCALIFCGPGSLLYPICDSDSDLDLELEPNLTSSSTSSSIPKACLPLANVPLLSYPLQSLLSCGIRHVTVLAKGVQHQEIIKSLSRVKLNDPTITSSTSEDSSSSSNIQIIQSNLKDGPTNNQPLNSTHSILVDLLPLGPNDSIPNRKSSIDPVKPAAAAADGLYDTNRSLGTAELLKWLAINSRLPVSIKDRA